MPKPKQVGYILIETLTKPNKSNNDKLQKNEKIIFPNHVCFGIP